MTLILLAVGLTDVFVNRDDYSKSSRKFSGQKIDNSLISKVQQAEDKENYIVFRNFITFCMGSNEYENVSEEDVYSAREKIISSKWIKQD